MASVEDLAKRLHLAVEEENRIAEYRIRVAWKLGQLLRVDSHRGGKGSKSPGVTSIRGGSSAPLPEGISKNQSMKFQRLAAVAEEGLDGYFRAANEAEDVVSIAGLLRHTEGARARAIKQATKHQKSDVPKVVLDAVASVADIDSCVGFARPQSWDRVQEVAAADAPEESIKGCVLVVAGPQQEAEWLSRLYAAWKAKRVTQAFVLLPAETGAAWFKLLEEQRWECCFFRCRRGERATLLAFHGEKCDGFRMAFGELGTMLGSTREHS